MVECCWRPRHVKQSPPRRSIVRINALRCRVSIPRRSSERRHDRQDKSMYSCVAHALPRTGLGVQYKQRSGLVPVYVFQHTRRMFHCRSPRQKTERPCFCWQLRRGGDITPRHSHAGLNMYMRPPRRASFTTVDTPHTSFSRDEQTVAELLGLWCGACRRAGCILLRRPNIPGTRRCYRR